LARALNQLVTGSDARSSVEIYANLLQYLMDVSQDLLFRIDAQGLIHHCNQKVYEALGASAVDVDGQLISALVYSHDQHLVDQLLAVVIDVETNSTSVEIRLNCADKVNPLLWV